MLSPCIVKVSVLGYFPLYSILAGWVPASLVRSYISLYINEFRLNF